MIRALIFDFDGLIVDTESADYQTWRALYDAHGVHLDMARWNSGIGSYDTFDPYDYLAEQLGQPVDREVIRAEHRALLDALMIDAVPLPGVLDWIAGAQRSGLRLGIASSSSHRWVEGFLAQLGLREPFQVICCNDDVERTKPDPALYRLALERLGVPPGHAVALEDSPNGVRAAKAAGLYCIAVPNPMTRGLDFDGHDLRLDSLADLSLDRFLDGLHVSEKG
ncbi:MAG: HAD family hydrolase [Anaerolineae bacterium]|nr:HAD family hydrolase [Anaerolineae bacterium]